MYFVYNIFEVVLLLLLKHVKASPHIKIYQSKHYSAFIQSESQSFLRTMSSYESPSSYEFPSSQTRGIVSYGRRSIRKSNLRHSWENEVFFGRTMFLRSS